jgi:hypothetical protein
VNTQVNLKGDIKLSNLAGLQREAAVYARIEEDIKKRVKEISETMKDILRIGIR